MATVNRNVIVQPRKKPRRIYWYEGEIQSSSLVLLTTINYVPFSSTDTTSMQAYGRIKAEVYSSSLALLSTIPPAPTILFRKTLSGIGGRIGSRQLQGH